MTEVDPNDPFQGLQHDTPWSSLRWAGVGCLVTLSMLAIVLWTMAR